MTAILGTTALTALTGLPTATRERWQPLRGGLLNLYRYDNEEFRYEHGHLLLRGNNGTGKSRVLALQLPFLLDGDASPHRLEPDGDPAKRIEWNLLLGTHDQRLGYTWLEFGRRDADGSERYVTLGAGLHAVKGRGLAGKWFFVTDQRIGGELFLQRADGAALSRDRLAEAVGDRGEVFTTASAYRARVDRTLFGLGEHRYGALVNLLIQLRQPQLSRQLDERRLSDALSEALPPVSDAVIGDVAEALRGLESDRTTLQAFQAAGTGVEAFLSQYRHYTQIIARRRADDVRSRHTDYETTMRRLRAAETGRSEARQAVTGATARVERLGLDEHAAQAAVDTLTDSPRMRDAHALDRAQRDAGARDKEAARAAGEGERADATRAERDRELEAAAAGARGTRAEVEAAASGATERAVAAGLDRVHAETVAELGLPDGPEPSSDHSRRLQRAAARTGQAATERRHAAREVQRLDRAVGEAAIDLRVARSEQDQVASQLEQALEDQRAAHAERDAAVTRLVSDYRDWAGSVHLLRPAEHDGVAWELGHWSGSGQGPAPVTAAVRAAAAAAGARISADRERLGHRLELLDGHLGELLDERERLREGRHLPPPAPHTRQAETRAERPGAPLWLLVDFADELDEAQRAGLEAAMEAAGILDAWVTPDGALLPADDHDTALVPADAPLAQGGLNAALVAAPPPLSAVPHEIVTAVLRRIGLGDQTGQVWVERDGRWRAGPLHGHWAKPAAEHVGAGAREDARRRRLAHLDAEVAEGERDRESLEVELARLEDDDAAVAAEVEAAPDEGDVRDALAAIGQAARAVAALRERVDETERRVAERRARHEARAGERDQTAADLRVSQWLDDLSALVDAVGVYEQAVAALWAELRTHLTARERAEQAERLATDAAETQRRCQELSLAARGRAEAAAAERDALSGRVGAGVEEILAELGAARQRVATARTDRERAREEQTAAATRAAVAEHDIAALGEALDSDERRRRAKIDALARYAGTGLLTLCHPELSGLEPDPGEWAADPAVRIARRIEQTLAGVDHDDLAWQRVQRGIHGHLQTLIETLLPHGYEPSAVLEDDVLVVTVPFQGRTCSMSQLRHALSEEVAHRQSLLDAREREVLENHLIGEVSAHLHGLLRTGEEWVAEVNAELEAAPTSTGMALRFVWRPREDGPAGLDEARRRLLRADGLWSPAEREALGAFLQEQIRVERSDNDTGTWQEHLAAALDYRSWHTFDVERRQDGQWKRLTRRTHGTGSGGEKAIALTLPQFAAAAAHYRGTPQAPRLILLDEAFVGVDADMRSKCMGLLHAFDLDFVMTSEREWGCYATLPGVAIYQLATRPGIDAVGVTRWVWNGRQRVRQEVDPLPAQAPAAAAG